MGSELLTLPQAIKRIRNKTLALEAEADYARAACTELADENDELRAICTELAEEYGGKEEQKRGA